jgi:hypothetical protein
VVHFSLVSAGALHNMPILEQMTEHGSAFGVSIKPKDRRYCRVAGGAVNDKEMKVIFR